MYLEWSMVLNIAPIPEIPEGLSSVLGGAGITWQRLRFDKNGIDNNCTRCSC